MQGVAGAFWVLSCEIKGFWALDGSATPSKINSVTIVKNNLSIFPFERYYCLNRMHLTIVVSFFKVFGYSVPNLKT